jgi:vacuolar-type H+-ATPase subunit E/Vma4
MMVGYNKRCKLCNCEHRAQVEQMHEDGASLQRIVDFLADHDVTLSKPAVKRHFDTHFAPKDEAAKQYYEKSEVVMQEAVEKRLTDLQMLDSSIERSFRLQALASDTIERYLTEDVLVISKKTGRPVLHPETMEPLKQRIAPPKATVDLYAAVTGEVRQTLKLKAEILGDKDPEGTVHIDMSAFTIEELRSLANLDAGEEENSS